MNREPTWCDQTDHDRPNRHFSQPRQVGAHTRDGGNGEVSVWLQQDDRGPVKVVVNVADGVGMTAEVDLDEARRLRDHLDALLHQAAHRPRNERS
jgi:hypothetical protein